MASVSGRPLLWSFDASIYAEISESLRFGIQDDDVSRVVQLALDGSWDAADPKVFAYGGVAALEVRWREIGTLWSAELTKHGLQAFHMVAAMNFRDEFRSFKGHLSIQERIIERDALLNRLVDVAAATGFRAFGNAADVRLLTTEKTKAGKKKQLFQGAVKYALEQMPADCILALICDREQDAAGQCLQWTENLRQQHAEHAQRIFGVCFVDSAKVAAVQIADMYVYLLREDTERGIFRPSEPRNPLYLKMLGEDAHMWAKDITAEAFDDEVR